MQQFKQLFQRMNLDSDVRNLQSGEYRLLKNGINVQATSVKSLQSVITSVYGNALVTNASLEANSVVVGFLEDRVNNRAFFAVYNPNNNHTIYQVTSALSISTVLRTSLFGFGATDFVDMDIIGDILVLSNGNNEIKKINVAYAAAGNYGTVTEEKITLLKRAPHYPLLIKKSNDGTFGNDFLGGVFVFMTYRYIYEDNEISAWAPPAFAPHFSTGQLNRVNYVISGSETIPTTVKRIDFAAWLNDSSELIIFETKDVSGGVAPSLDYFYNKTGYTADDSGSVKWNDSVPLKSKSIRFCENRLFTFNNTEGFAIPKSKLSGFTVAASPLSAGINVSTVATGQFGIKPDSVSGILVSWDDNGSMSTNKITVPDDLVGTISVSMDIEIAWAAGSGSVFFKIQKNGVDLVTSDVISYPTTSGTITENTPQTNISLSAGDEITVRIYGTGSVDDEVSIATTSTLIFQVSGTQSQPLKNRGLYSVGIAFFDRFGRLIGIREAQNQVDVPDRDENALTIDDVYQIAWDLTGVALADIPLSAHYYTLMKTKCLNVSYFITGRTADIFFYEKASNGTISYNKTYSNNNTGLAIDISHLADEYQQGYTFSAGDRLFIYNSDGTTKDFIIRSQDGRFVYVDNFDLPGMLSAATNRYFEIYTPKSPSVNEPFFEAMMSINGYIRTAKIPITNPGTVSRAFSILQADGTTNTGYRLIGDCIFDDGFGFEGLRTSDYTYAASGYAATAPYSNTREPLARGAVIAMNYLGKFWDKWIQTVGKRAAVVPLVDGAEINKYSYVRFSQPYIQNSLINGTNTFEAADEYPLPIENGEGTMLVRAGDVLVGIHKVETTAIYVGEGFINTSSGTSFLSKTEGVIGDDRKYLGGHGTTHQSSVVSRNSRVYFYDSRKGCIVRRAQDGLTIISDYGVKGLVAYLAKIHNADTANSKIVAGWDPQYDCYCISFFLTGGSYNFTLYFHEKSNSWVCATDEMPERWGILEQRKIGFLAGGLWIQTVEANYNNWFGVQYNRRLEFEISPIQSLVHLWDALEVDVERIYATAGTNEDVVLLYHENGGTLQTKINYADFQLKEGVYRSSFFRWLHDITFQNQTESKYKSPHQVRGQSAFLVITYNGTDKNVMKSITVFYTPSMNSSP